MVDILGVWASLVQYEAVATGVTPTSGHQRSAGAAHAGGSFAQFHLRLLGKPSVAWISRRVDRRKAGHLDGYQ